MPNANSGGILIMHSWIILNVQRWVINQRSGKIVGSNAEVVAVKR